MNPSDADRKFLSPDEIVTGKSVVRETGRAVGSEDRTPANPWPYILSDYLRNFVGKTVRVNYLLTDKKCCEKRGTLIVVGSNFIGLQPDFSEDLSVIELSLIRRFDVVRFLEPR